MPCVLSKSEIKSGEIGESEVTIDEISDNKSDINKIGKSGEIGEIGEIGKSKIKTTTDNKISDRDLEDESHS